MCGIKSVLFYGNDLGFILGTRTASRLSCGAELLLVCTELSRRRQAKYAITDAQTLMCRKVIFIVGYPKACIWRKDKKWPMTASSRTLALDSINSPHLFAAKQDVLSLGLGHLYFFDFGGGVRG